MRWNALGALLLAAVLAVAAPAGAGSTTKPLPPRKSFDGVPLPDAAPEWKLKAALPVIGNKLGGRPEEVIPRLLSVEKSKADFESRASALSNRPEWFALNALGADAVGVRLTDGRVTDLQLTWNHISAAAFRAHLAEIEKAGRRDPATGYYVLHLGDVPVTVNAASGAGTGSLNFRIDPAGWYATCHDVTPEVAAALKSHRVVKGMQQSEAELSVSAEAGGPRFVRHSETRHDDGTLTIRWAVCERAGRGDRTLRSISARISGGVVTSCEETSNE